MKDIRIYSSDLSLFMIKTKFLSVDTTKYFCSMGKIEMHFDKKDPDAENLINMPFMIASWDGGDYIITGRRIDGDIALFGRTLDYIFTGYVLDPFEEISAAASDIASHLMAMCLPDITVTLPEDDSDIITYSKDDCTSLYDDITELLSQHGMGYKVYLDRIERKICMDITEGKDNLLLLSEKNKNAHDIVYTLDEGEFFTGGKYLDSDSGEWLYAGCEADLPFKRDTVLISKNAQDALSEISRKKKIKKITAKPVNIHMGKDYLLGDRVRCMMSMGSSDTVVYMKVTGAVSHMDKSGYDTYPLMEEV